MGTKTIGTLARLTGIIGILVLISIVGGVMYTIGEYLYGVSFAGYDESLFTFLSIVYMTGTTEMYFQILVKGLLSILTGVGIVIFIQKAYEWVRFGSKP